MINKKLNNLLFYMVIIGVLALHEFAYAESTRLAQYEGLEASNVSAIMFDHQGFMWIGSQHGLFVFDGKQIQNFEPNFSQQNTISAIDIRNIYQSTDNSIWISTNSGGLNLFQPHDNSFINFRHDSNDPTSLSNDSIYDVIDGPDGDLWIATQIGLNRLDRNTNKITQFFAESHNPNSIPNDYIYDLYVDSNHRLWLASIGGGIAYWHPEHQHFVSVPLPDDIVNVFAIKEVKGKNLFLATRKGLVQLDLASLEPKKVNLSPLSTSSPIIISLHHTADNKLLLGTHGYGLLSYDLSKNSLNSDQSLAAKNVDTVTQFASNHKGELFFATWGNGIHYLEPSSPTYSNNAQTRLYSLADITSIHHDHFSDKTWVGSFRKGLYQLDPSSGSLIKHKGITDSVVSIAQLRPNRLYIGSATNLLEVSTDGEILNTYDHEPNSPFSIGKGFIRVLKPSHDGNLWIGTGGSGLFSFNPDTEKFTAIEHDNNNPNSISGNYVTALLVEDDYLWVGTRSNGLNRCIIATWNCQRFTPENSTISHYYISDLEKDKAGNVWVGTDGGGLQTVTIENNKITGFASIEELSDLGNSIKSILPHSDGSIWLTTNEGIYIYYPNHKHYIQISNSHTETLGAFTVQSKGKSETDHFFGAHNGLISLNHTKNFQLSESSPIRFTRIAHDSFGQPLINAAIDDNHQLSVPWGGMLSIEFALLEYRNNKHIYEYRIAPNSKWVSLGNKNQINFFKLEPGLHNVEIRGKRIADKWSEPAKLSIEIVPPWWLNNTYRTFIVLIMALAALSYHKMRMYKWRRYTNELKRLKEQKQTAIEKLEDREVSLKTAYQRIRNLASKIQNAKEDERKSISRELHDEFGQSLTASQINLQFYKKQNEKSEQPIDDTIKIIQTMIEQVRSISFNLRPTALDDVGLVAGVTQQLEKMSAPLATPIKFSVQANFPTLNQDLTTALFRIIQESVNNAIRHAQASYIAVSLKCTEDKVYAEITDNGVGFDISSIREKAVGGHLGLLGIEERVSANNGKLFLNSNINQGTSVKVEFTYESI